MTLSAWWRSKAARPPERLAPLLTFCAHRLHCRECHEQTVLVVQPWQAKVAALERELARLRGIDSEAP